MNLDLSPPTRRALWQQLQESVEEFYSNTLTLTVAPELNQQQIQSYISQLAERNPSPEDALADVTEGMNCFAVHTPHPRYFGLFNPRAAFPGVLADALSAAFNPQLAAWSHAPFAVEVENYLIREIGQRFGYQKDTTDGVFTSGGAEANLTAVQLALNHHFPTFTQSGLFGITKRPVIYVSAESHHSVVKAARVAGLGDSSVKIIPVNHQFQMISSALEEQVAKDKKQDLEPFMVIATGGTTGAGAIDPIPAISEICQRHSLWLHLDAVYGGAVVFEKTTRRILAGSEKANSITFDAHKWLSMPMSTSMLLTRHKDILSKAFGIINDYMPKDAAGVPVNDPFTHSIQWSRRFSGLKLYLTICMVGWQGISQLIPQQIQLGNQLKALLTDHHWIIKNDTELPVICFIDSERETESNFAAFVCRQIVTSGQAWLSTYQLGNTTTLRACITNYATTEENLVQLVQLLNQFRNQYNP